MSNYGHLPATPENLDIYKVTIANGASESDGVATEGRALVGLIMPAAWTAADICYKSSLDGVTYKNLLEDSGGNPLRTVVVADADIAMPLTDAAYRNFIKLVSTNTASEAAVNQGAAREIVLIFRRFLGGH